MPVGGRVRQVSRSLTGSVARAPHCSATLIDGPFREFLDSLADPVLLVDKGGFVITANARARSALGKDLEDIEGILGGEVMECAFARLPGGCGRTAHCAACEVRASVTYTIETGSPLSRVEAYVDVATPRGSERRQLFISTERVGQAVLLRLDVIGIAEIRAQRPAQST